MPAQALARINSSFSQCDALIVSAHRLDASGHSIFSPRQQELITQSAFLNMFIAWESFLEEILSCYMTGATTINGSTPVKMVSPLSIDDAKKMLKGVMKYFDFGNHEYVKQISKIYFHNAFPLELTSVRSIQNSPT